MIHKRRIWEIDFLRGIAIILMFVFHTVYDLTEFYDYRLDYLNGFWFFVGRTSAVMFIVLSGVSSNFSNDIFRRSLRVLAAAALVSAVTYLHNPLFYVRFGILHLLGVCMLISIVFHGLEAKRAVWGAALAGAAAFFLGYLFAAKSLTANTPLFIPLGIPTPEFRSVDYYPLFPWAGFFLCGLALGKFFYGNGRSLLTTSLSSLPPVLLAGFLGRHSLFIYLSHQPIIMSILFLFHYKYIS